jgi:hypothetical protein
MSIKPRTATVVIYQGDDLERLSELRRKADTAERIQRENADSARIGDGDDSGVAELKAAYDAFVEEAAERAEVVTLRAIGRGRWRDLLADHQPREVDGEPHPDDAVYGCNVETLPDALLTFVDGDVRTIESPEFATSKACRDFLDNDLSAGDFESLWVTAYWLNVSPGADPKASRYSLDTPSSSETSMSPGRLG